MEEKPVQRTKKVYPSGHAPLRRLGWLMVLLAAAVMVSGLAGRKEPQPFIEALPTATLFPLSESFDETVESCEWTLPEQNWYALQLGAFDSEPAAQETAEQFRLRGAAGYLWHTDRYRVLAAVYASEDDARTVRTQIREQHGIDSYIYPIRLPGAGVSMQGMRGQIEILKAGFIHAAELIAQLQQYSLLADRPDGSIPQIVEGLQALRDQTSLVALRLGQRFPEPRNSCVAGLLELFAGYSDFCSAMDANIPSVGFGAQLKYQTIQSLDLLMQVYDTLGNT
jgi:hypothetical protein